MWESNLIMNGCDENKFMTANKLQVIQVQWLPTHCILQFGEQSLHYHTPQFNPGVIIVPTDLQNNSFFN